MHAERRQSSQDAVGLVMESVAELSELALVVGGAGEWREVKL